MNTDKIDKGVDAILGKAGHKQNAGTTEKISDGIRSAFKKVSYLSRRRRKIKLMYRLPERMSPLRTSSRALLIWVCIDCSQIWKNAELKGITVPGFCVMIFGCAS